MSPPPGVAPGTHTAGVLRTIPALSSVWISKIWAMQGVEANSGLKVRTSVGILVARGLDL